MNRKQGMNWIRVEKRWAIYHRDGYQCIYCGSKGVALTLDHIRPVAKGGSNGPRNLITCCQTCNKKKGTLSVSQYLKGISSIRLVEWIKVRIRLQTRRRLIAPEVSTIYRYPTILKRHPKEGPR